MFWWMRGTLLKCVNFCRSGLKRGTFWDPSWNSQNSQLESEVQDWDREASRGNVPDWEIEKCSNHISQDWAEFKDGKCSKYVRDSELNLSRVVTRGIGKFQIVMFHMSCQGCIRVQTLSLQIGGQRSRDRTFWQEGWSPGIRGRRLWVDRTFETSQRFQR